MAIVCLLFALPAGAEDAREVDPRFPDPPRLATTRAELAELKQAPGFEAKRQQAIKAAGPPLANPPPIPDGYGSWIFYYACPEDGATLRMRTTHVHVCPTCKIVYSDDRTTAAYRCYQHHDLEHASVKLGWAYAYSGEDKYAAGVRRILLALAEAYEDYPKRLDRWGRRGILARLGGRRYVQSLDEAVGVIRLAKGYDLTRSSSVWSDEDRQQVEERFFRPTAASLLAFNQDINNHQTWYNAGITACGSVLGDAELIRKALAMRGGFYDQLERSIGDEGLWYEGAIAYHVYALQAMLEIVDAGRRLGLPLHKEERFKSMFRGPLLAAYPNGRLPAINDSDQAWMKTMRPYLKWAEDVYEDPEITRPPETGSMDLADAGLVRLQRGDGTDAACLFLDYGEHGGGHGHFDKLNIVLYANGREWILDPGRLTYRHKEYKTWVKHTVAHNTVAIDGRSQRASAGRLLWIENTDAYAACAAAAADAYTKANHYRRYLLLADKMLVDAFDVRVQRKADLDWIAHAVAATVEPTGDVGEPKESSPGKRDGYNHLLDGRAWKISDNSQWDFTARDGKKLRLWFDADGRAEVFLANGIGYTTSQRVPCIVRRRRARQTRFVTVFDLSGNAGYVTSIRDSGERGLQIETIDGPWSVVFHEHGVTVERQ